MEHKMKQTDLFSEIERQWRVGKNLIVNIKVTATLQKNMQRSTKTERIRKRYFNRIIEKVQKMTHFIGEVAQELERSLGQVIKFLKNKKVQGYFEFL